MEMVIVAAIHKLGERFFETDEPYDTAARERVRAVSGWVLRRYGVEKAGDLTWRALQEWIA